MDGSALADLARSSGAENDLVDALEPLREVEGPNSVMKELRGECGGPTEF